MRSASTSRPPTLVHRLYILRQSGGDDRTLALQQLRGDRAVRRGTVYRRAIGRHGFGGHSRSLALGRDFATGHVSITIRAIGSGPAMRIDGGVDAPIRACRIPMSICLRFAKCELGVRTAADVAIAVAERAPAGAVGSASHGFR